MKVSFKNVEKRFKENIVLKDITLDFEEGKIYGLAGRNGSGKSVLLKMICGLYLPTKGEITWNQKKLNMKKEFPENMGALIEKPNFLTNLSGMENLILLSKIQNKITEKDILKSLDIVNLLNEKDKKYSKYSLGMKQKLGIAQAIMEDPEFLILDEPFNGIEKDTVDKIKKYLKKLKQNHKTIIISSHIKEDLEELCDEILYFDAGNIIKD